MKFDILFFEKAWTFVLYGICGLILFFLVSPLIAIVPLSFNSEPFFTYPIPGFSLQWYEQFFNSNAWMLALKNILMSASYSD